MMMTLPASSVVPPGFHQEPDARDRHGDRDHRHGGLGRLHRFAALSMAPDFQACLPPGQSATEASLTTRGTSSWGSTGFALKASSPRWRSSARERDERDGRGPAALAHWQLAHARDERVTVLDRHADVGNQHVGPQLAQLAEALDSGARAHDLRAMPLEDARDDRAAGASDSVMRAGRCRL